MKFNVIFLLLCCVQFSYSWMVYDLQDILNKFSYDVLKSTTTFDKDLGSPLILTPYLEQGNIAEALNASYVKPFIENVHSYSGYFTVNRKYNSNMFFWYFPSEESPETDPLVIWLQGGPGGSSLFGLFVENGPYVITKEGSVNKSSIYWTKTMNVIYIDNPVGTGFSFTDSGGYLRDEASIGKQLYRFLQQFLTLFPSLRKNDLYLSGESYAGKYVPAFAYTIHKNNQNQKDKINLKGIAIGNGFSDPMNQIDYGNMLRGIGLIDKKQNERFQKLQNETRNYFSNKLYKRAMNSYRKILGGASSLFVKNTGYTYPYNYLFSEDFLDSSYTIFLNSSNTRKAIHVGNQDYYMISSNVYNSLQDDFLLSVSPWIAELANNYKVMLYSGQLDIIVGYHLTVDFLNQLDWCGAEDWPSVERKQWYVGSQLAGYVKTLNTKSCNGTFSLVMVRNAGHMVPSDQPLWAYSLIHDFTKENIGPKV